jgi:hypothetical protein
MRLVTYVKDKSLVTAHQYYAPHHYRNAQPYEMRPGDSILVTLGGGGEPLGHVTTRFMCGKKKMASCHYVGQDKLGLIVTFPLDGGVSQDTVIFIPSGSYLNDLLKLKIMKSRFVAVLSTTSSQKKTKVSTKKRSASQRNTGGQWSCCHTPSDGSSSSSSSSSVSPEKEEETDSCTDHCDHSDIDDDDDDDDADNDVVLI